MHMPTIGAGTCRWPCCWRRATAIPSSTRRGNLAGNLAAREIVLGVDDVAAIDALERGERLVSPDFGPEWD